jgi:hypothetical protein
MRSTPPRSAVIAGSAVATIVWSATARNIGSMTDGKTAQNNPRADGSAAAADFAPSDVACVKSSRIDRSLRE